MRVISAPNPETPQPTVGRGVNPEDLTNGSQRDLFESLSLNDQIKVAEAALRQRERREFEAWKRECELRDLAAARAKVVLMPAPATRTPNIAAPRERRESSSSRSSGQDPGDDDPDPEDDGLALGFVDRAPLLWRFRALRCRLLEIREGVDR